MNMKTKHTFNGKEVLSNIFKSTKGSMYTVQNSSRFLLHRDLQQTKAKSRYLKYSGSSRCARNPGFTIARNFQPDIFLRKAATYRVLKGSNAQKKGICTARMQKLEPLVAQT